MPYFFRKLGKMSENLSSAAVVIGALRVNQLIYVICEGITFEPTDTFSRNKTGTIVILIFASQGY